MGRTNNNLKEAKQLGYKKTMKQLKIGDLTFMNFLWVNLVMIF